MFDQNKVFEQNSALVRVVKSLGNHVVYNPDHLFTLLRNHYSPVGETEFEQNVRVVMTLYRQKKHSIDPPVAGGIVQLVYSGRHVSVIVLNEYLRLRSE